MAAPTTTRNANTLHLTGGTDATDVLTQKNVVVLGVILQVVTAGTFSLADVSTSATKAVLYGAANTTQFIDLSGCPILFPNGVRATLGQTDMQVTLIIAEKRG